MSKSEFVHMYDKIKRTKTTGDGRRRLRLLFITERSVAQETCREVLYFIPGVRSHVLQ